MLGTVPATTTSFTASVSGTRERSSSLISSFCCVMNWANEGLQLMRKVVV